MNQGKYNAYFSFWIDLARKGWITCIQRITLRGVHHRMSCMNGHLHWKSLPCSFVLIILVRCNLYFHIYIFLLNSFSYKFTEGGASCAPLSLYDAINSSLRFFSEFPLCVYNSTNSSRGFIALALM